MRKTAALLLSSLAIVAASCVPPEPAPPPPTVPPNVLAIAYTRTSDPLNDGTIAALIDENGDGMVSVGDVVQTGGYPIDMDVTSFGTFAVTEHPVAEVVLDDQYNVAVRSTPGAGGDYFLWIDNTVSDQYIERVIGPPLVETQLRDYDATSAGDDLISVSPGSPSMPTVSATAKQSYPDRDDKFLDVHLNN